MVFRLEPEPTGGTARVERVDEDGTVTVQAGVPGFSDASTEGKMLILNVFVRGRPAEALVDCGSAVNVLSTRMAAVAGITVDAPPTARQAVMADGTTIDIKGIVQNVPLRIADSSQLVTFYVIDTTRDVILGMDWLSVTNPVINWKDHTMTWVQRPMTPTQSERLVVKSPPPPIYQETHTTAPDDPTATKPVTLEKPTKPKVKTRDETTAKVVSAHRMAKILKKEIVQLFYISPRCPEGQRPLVELATLQMDVDGTATDPRLEALLKSYQDVFPDELPVEAVHHEITHRIDTMDGIPPYYEKFRRLEYSMYEEMQKQLGDLLKQQRIRPSSSPWGAPLVFARKPDGGWRLCIDYRRLNAITARNGYTIPRMDELTDRLHGARVFTKIDLRQGYWQVKMTEKDIPKTAFTTPVGQFEWIVMPMGLAGSGATFQRLMNTTFPYMEFPFVLIYLDDILIHSKTVDEHILHLDAVLARLRKAKLYAKKDKCVFAKDHVTYLGQTYGDDTVRADPSKVLAVTNWQPPETVTQLRSFIGVAVQLRKHIRGFAQIIAPLTDQMRGAPKGNQPIHWGQEQHSAFSELKKRICSAPILQLYDPNRETLVQTDASTKAIGAVLLQRTDNDEWLPVYYESRRLSDREASYTVYELELLAIQHALTKWRQYLLGRKFTMQTDHRALERLPVQKVVGYRIARWVELMQQFDFKIGYQAGKLNVIADALSRMWAREVQELDKGGKCIEDTLSTSDVHAINIAPPCVWNTKEKPEDYPEATPDVEVNMLEQLPATKPWRESGVLMTEAGDRSVVAALVTSSASLAPAVIRRIKDAYTRDKVMQQVCKALKAAKSDRDKLPKAYQCYTMVGDLVYTNKGGHQRLYVAGKDEQIRVMTEYHDSKIGGHFGIIKTISRMQKHVYWPKMARDCKEYVRTCERCQRSKPVRDKPQGLLKPIPVPTDRWQHISLDMAGPLPASGGYNAIAMVVDMFSKRVCLIPSRNDVDAEGLAKLLFDNCFKTFGLPETITSDRDTKFQSAFWQSLFKRVGSTVQMTTSYHPQADGQTERMIGTMKQYLTIYANYAQDTWADDLPMAEWCMNSQESATTGMTPFYADTGREARVPFNVALLGPDAEDRVETVEQRIARLLRIRDEVMTAANKAKAQQKKFADRHRREADVYQPNELVWVSNEVFRRDKGTVGEAAPLRKKWAGPFTVIAMDAQGNYELDLEGRLNHNVFHPDKLQRFNTRPAILEQSDATQPKPDVDSEGEELWEVQDILDRKMGRNRQWSYKVHWKGYPMERAQWVLESNLDNCRDTVDAFNAKYVGSEQLIRERKRRTVEPQPDSVKQAKKDRSNQRWTMRNRRIATDKSD